MIVFPPLTDGAVNEMLAVVGLVKVAVPIVGAAGTVLPSQPLGVDIEIPAFVRSKVLHNSRFVIALFKKALLPTVVTELGIVSDVRLVAPEKALAPIVVTSFGIVSEARLVAPANALAPMDITLFPIVSDVSEV